jgi:hypothetical protein
MPDYLTLWSGKRGADAHVKCIGIGATWHSFFDPAVAAMQQAQQTLMPYMLIDENDV